MPSGNLGCDVDDDEIVLERREIFEEYAYTTFGTLAARRIVEDVQDIRDEWNELSCFP